jgi:hypothetical protein
VIVDEQDSDLVYLSARIHTVSFPAEVFDANSLREKPFAQIYSGKGFA